jgi:putative SOS response-associated peptidase YedK
MAGIVGIRAEDMEQVDALQRARLEFPNGFPMVRPSVRTLVLVQEDGRLVAKPARFGFTNAFASFNARVDKLATSPFWKSMFGKEHGIAPLSYVIEWMERDGVRQPYLIQRADGRLIMAPALVGHSRDEKKEPAFAIVTRDPNRFFGFFHPRMVGHCTPELMETWLHPSRHSAAELAECVAAPRDDELVAVPASPEIQKRVKGDWSALKTVGPPITWKDVEGKLAGQPLSPRPPKSQEAQRSLDSL